MLTAPEKLAQQQKQFAAHLRAPDKNAPVPDIEDRRLQIYRDLFYNNVQNFLANGFPVLRSLFSEEHWHAMVRNFYSRHQCHSPLFRDISKEFLDYLNDSRDVESDPPFMRELAHYEWMELAMAVSDADTSPQKADPNGDLLKGIPVLSPVATPLMYGFPVHRISKEFQPTEKPPTPTCLVVYRDRTEKVRFMEINVVTAMLLNRFSELQASGEHHLRAIADEIGFADAGQLVSAGHDILLKLKERGIILGVAR